MSKTGASLGLIIGGIALAAVSYGASTGMIALGMSAQVTTQMIGIGLSVTLAGVGMALQPTVQSTTTANSIAFNAGVSPRRVIYGQYQTAGVLTYSSFPPGQNLATTSQFLHLIFTLAGHEIQSFDAVFVNGTVYNFGSDIFDVSSLPGTPWSIIPDLRTSPPPSDFYWEHMFFEFDCGNFANGAQPFPNLAAADSAWTSACRQQGCAKVHVILRADSGSPQLYPSGSVPNIQFLVTGKILTDPRVQTSWQPSKVYARFSYHVDNNGFIWWQQNSSGLPTSGTVRPNFEGSDTAGTTIADNTCSWYCTGFTMASVNNKNPIPPQLFNARLVNDGWYPGPSITYGSSVVNQLVIEAPMGYLQLLTTAGTPATTHPTFATPLGSNTIDGTAVWTCLGRSWHAVNPSNSALVVNDYLQDTDAGMGTSPASIDTASVIAAANVCEEQELIIWNSDGTVVYENLYSCNGMFDHEKNRGDVLSGLCGSMAGWAIPPGDLWHLFAGSYVTPTLGFTDKDLRGPVKGDFRISKREVANSIKGKYVPAYLPANPAAAIGLTVIPGTWQPQSFPAYQANGLAGKPNYLNTEDGGQIIWQDVLFEYTTSVWTAQRLAKIALMRMRFQQTLALAFKLTAFQLEAGDTFFFTHPRWDINNAVFQATQCSLTVDNSGGGDPIIGVDVVARLVDPSIYSFTPPSSSTDYGEYSPFGVTGEMSGVE